MDGKKAAIGLGVAAVAITGIILATRKAKAAPPLPPPGYANLYGKVTHSATGQAISGVLVTLDSRQAYTDVNGDYALVNIPVGSYTANFSKAGYESRVY